MGNEWVGEEGGERESKSRQDKPTRTDKQGGLTDTPAHTHTYTHTLIHTHTHKQNRTKTKI